MLFVVFIWRSFCGRSGISCFCDVYHSGSMKMFFFWFFSSRLIEVRETSWKNRRLEEHSGFLEITFRHKILSELAFSSISAIFLWVDGLVHSKKVQCPFCIEKKLWKVLWILKRLSEMFKHNFAQNLPKQFVRNFYFFPRKFIFRSTLLFSFVGQGGFLTCGEAV